MRVRMRVQISGTRDGREWPPRGGLVDLPAAEAAQLCAAGMAEPCPEDPPVQTAAAKPAPRTAARRK